MTSGILRRHLLVVAVLVMGSPYHRYDDVLDERAAVEIPQVDEAADALHANGICISVKILTS